MSDKNDSDKMTVKMRGASGIEYEFDVVANGTETKHFNRQVRVWMFDVYAVHLMGKDCGLTEVGLTEVGIRGPVEGTRPGEEPRGTSLRCRCF